MAEANWAKSYIPGGTKDDYVRLDKQGMRALLTGPEITAELRQRMLRVQAALPGSQLEIARNSVRTRVKVIRGSDYDEANTGDMARALDLAGGRRGEKRKTRKPRARK